MLEKGSEAVLKKLVNDVGLMVVVRQVGGRGGIRGGIIMMMMKEVVVMRDRGFA